MLQSMTEEKNSRRNSLCRGSHGINSIYTLNKRKWEFKLHSWVQNVSTYSKNFTIDSEYWLVCWRSSDGPLTFKEIDASNQRCENTFNYI